ncbi:outer membrane beta-barrel protein [Pinibacter soli]|uniref:Outer membrane beta-barrel protein n=1 Tax=Pinibacter soli TaxID=3044211 RepID=A0ABT6RDK9_9BACT|nr:outer membrane beta-barrel protein [Pinibacter soli]MDI3320659.1 outer membrane beta-barrel protein [Pinibacter soli]
MKIKTTVIITFMLAYSTIAQSQVIISLLFGDKLNSEKLNFGLLVGNSWAHLSDYKTSSSLSNFNLGLYLSLKMSERFFLQFDAMAKYRLGSKGLPVYNLNDVPLDTLFATGHVKRELNYLGLVTTAQYRAFNYFNIEAGPQIILRTKAKDIFYTDRNNGTLNFEKDISDAATRFDIGAMTGISYQIKGNGVKIGVRYYFGFIDIFPQDAGSNTNRSFQLGAYIPVGRKKALAKKQQAENKQGK